MPFFFFPIRFWLFSQPWTIYARKATESAVRALLGMSSPTLREVPNAKIRLSTGAVRLIAD